jgi:hypothetical protein
MITRSSAADSGGAMYTDGDTDVTVTNCKVSLHVDDICMSMSVTVPTLRIV